MNKLHNLHNPESDEDILKKWDNIGFLEGLDDKYKLKVAKLMEDATKILLSVDGYTDGDTKLETVAFPIIRRVAQSIIDGQFKFSYDDVEYENIKDGLVELITAEFILKNAVRIGKPTYKLYDIIYDGIDNVDREAEATAFMSDRITHLHISKFKNKLITKTDEGYVVVNKPLDSQYKLR